MDAPDLGAVLLIMRQRTLECVTKTDATDFVGCSISLNIIDMRLELNKTIYIESEPAFESVSQFTETDRIGQKRN